MIKNLRIQNFQSHKDTELKLSPGVNVLVGVSDTGKSAIIRALRWLVCNRPQGDEFCSSWGGETRVSVELDKHTIERVKDKENTYILNDLKFKAVKSEVPEEIQEILNLNEISFGYQFDRPFLLDSTSGEVAQHFNRVAHLDKIDNTNRNIQSWLRTIEQDISNSEQQIGEMQAELKKYENLDVIEEKVVLLEEINQQVNEKQTQVQKITIISSDILLIDEKINNLKTLTSLEKQVAAIYELIQRKKQITEQHTQLNACITQNKTNVLNSGLYKTVLQAEQPLIKTQLLINDRDSILRRKRQLGILLVDMDSIDIDIHHMEDVQKKLQKDFDISFPPICPLCGSIKEA
jgi:DNA repair protein SbcC/Rad50